MGLFDSVIGSVLSEVQKQGGLASALGPLLANDGAHGGLNGLIQKFNQAGMGELITSWIGKGENLPISADQLKQVLGEGTIADIASKFGMTPGQAGGHMADMLPGIIDQLTPHGTAPQGGLGNAGDLMGMLGGLLHKPS
ncbi:MAG: DUF937 domain-containing protein [Burkholderiaceae bacterium]|nr:DUF937 domain-containing protein [Burkholderiaceae bacterium]